MSSTNPSTTANNNTLVSLAIIALSAVALLIVGFLVYQGRDIQEVIGFAMILIPLVISNVFMSRQLGKVQDSSDTIKRAVNGELTAKFTAIHDRHDALSSQLDELKTDVKSLVKVPE